MQTRVRYNVGEFESIPVLPSPSASPYQVAMAECHCGSETRNETTEWRESNVGRRKGKRMVKEKERAAAIC